MRLWILFAMMITASTATALDFTFENIDGGVLNLQEFRGSPVLIVNTASRCGFTHQYEGLQKLYEKYSEQGFEVLGFPCNQFGEQEKGSEPEIKGFCEANYSISFPMFSKVDVNGDNASPVFEFLKKQAKGFLGTESVKWNFSKFLVGRDGKTVKRYGSLDAPEILNNDIEAFL